MEKQIIIKHILDAWKARCLLRNKLLNNDFLAEQKKLLSQYSIDDLKRCLYLQHKLLRRRIYQQVKEMQDGEKNND